jgi:4-aminobutyrate aminotransferase-like enzyme
MLATEFDSADRANAIIEHCRTKGRLLLTGAGTRRRTLRWSPPLIVTNEEVDEALAAFKAAIRATSKG